MEYIVITAIGTDDLEKKVNQKLKEGYTLAGGVAVAHEILHKNGYSIFQAMVKLTEKEKET